MRPACHLMTLAGRPACCSPKGSDHLLPFIKFIQSLVFRDATSRVPRWRMPTSNSSFTIPNSSMVLITVRQDISIECDDVIAIPDTCFSTIAIVVQRYVNVNLDFS